MPWSEGCRICPLICEVVHRYHDSHSHLVGVRYSTISGGMGKKHSNEGWGGKLECWWKKRSQGWRQIGQNTARRNINKCKMEAQRNKKNINKSKEALRVVHNTVAVRLYGYPQIDKYGHILDSWTPTYQAHGFGTSWSRAGSRHMTSHLHLPSPTCHNQRRGPGRTPWSACRKSHPALAPWATWIAWDAERKITTEAM